MSVGVVMGLAAAACWAGAEGHHAAVPAVGHTGSAHAPLAQQLDIKLQGGCARSRSVQARRRGVNGGRSGETVRCCVRHTVSIMAGAPS